MVGALFAGEAVADFDDGAVEAAAGFAGVAFAAGAGDLTGDAFVFTGPPDGFASGALPTAAASMLKTT